MTLCRPTKIILVMNAYGGDERCLHHPNLSLFEVAEGPYRRRRGCTICLEALVGKWVWDETRVSDYLTCEIKQVA